MVGHHLKRLEYAVCGVVAQKIPVASGLGVDIDGDVGEDTEVFYLGGPSREGGVGGGGSGGGDGDGGYDSSGEEMLHSCLDHCC